MRKQQKTGRVHAQQLKSGLVLTSQSSLFTGAINTLKLLAAERRAAKYAEIFPPFITRVYFSLGQISGRESEVPE
jgi:hypothetical protein